MKKSRYFFWIKSDTDYNGFRILGSAFVLCYSIIVSFPLVFLFLIQIFKLFGLYKKKLDNDGNKNKKIIDSEKTELYIEMNQREELVNDGMGEKDNNDNDNLLNNNIINDDNDDKEINTSNNKNKNINNNENDIIIDNNENKKEEEEKLNQNE